MSDEANAANTSTSARGGSNKLLLIVIIVLVFLLIAIGVGLFFALSGSKEVAKEEGKAAHAAPASDSGGGGHGGGSGGSVEEGGEGVGAIFPLETFIVNLKIKGSFLKTDIQLVFTGAEVPANLKNEAPKIRDVIILILTSKTATEVLTVEGKEQLREEIKSAVNDLLGSNMVIQVLFTDFIVQ